MHYIHKHTNTHGNEAMRSNRSTHTRARPIERNRGRTVPKIVQRRPCLCVCVLWWGGMRIMYKMKRKIELAHRSELSNVQTTLQRCLQLRHNWRAIQSVQFSMLLLSMWVSTRNIRWLARTNITHSCSHTT